MSSLRTARKAAIHNKALDIRKEVSRLNASLNAQMSEVLIYAAAMHKINLDAIANGETDKAIESEDVAFYDAKFNEQMTGLQATMARLAPLVGLQTGALTKENFIATFDENTLQEYIDQFDGAKL